jgi:hypothetical protein
LFHFIQLSSEWHQYNRNSGAFSKERRDSFKNMQINRV